MARKIKRASTDAVSTRLASAQHARTGIEPAEPLNDAEAEVFAAVCAELSHEELREFSVLAGATRLAQLEVQYRNMRAQIETDGLMVRRSTYMAAHPLLAAAEKALRSIMSVQRALGLSGSTADRDPKRTRERRAKLAEVAGKPRAAITPIDVGPGGKVDWTKVRA